MVKLIRKQTHNVLTYAVTQEQEEYLITLIYSGDRLVSDSISVRGVELDRDSQSVLRDELIDKIKPLIEKELHLT